MLDMTKLLSLMVEHGASDLYVTIDSPPMYRIDGVVRPAGNKMLNATETSELAYSIMDEKQRSEFDESHELNHGISYPNFGRFRVNVFRQRGAVGMVVRQIQSTIPTLDQLELPQALRDVSMTKRGLVLVVGATGSGKSTTLAAMLNHRNENSAGHIITIEDPVEFVHEHKKCIVTQREVGIDTNTFQTALKNTLRQAPDVILIGEIRDKETMESAITFAETGHLCLATLHSNNANQTMERILNFFPHEQHEQLFLQLSLNLRGIISQRLVPTVTGARVAAVEILLDSPYAKDLIYKGQVAELKDAMEKGETFGMQTFDQHLYKLYTEKKITLDEALKNADSANNLRLKVKLSEEGGFKKAEPSLKKKSEKEKEDDGDLQLQLD